MALYAITGMIGVGLGVLVALLSDRTHLKLPVIVVLATTPVITGTMLIVSACFLSSRVTSHMAVVTAVSESSGKTELTMTDGATVSCRPRHKACYEARAGDVATYQTQNHESGLWVEKREVILVSRPDQ
ncbi:hypothetical protein FBF31_02495 [Candidatus Saccharibacteria bacterium oral taxon 955]|nr:hypothetical protein FBF33_02485 [Candidatus Saccharibacteria bacterium oral taxon 955]QJU05936.1 hypothetical protein FBF31_02495 [Candidatus Saccharibacteria bacterium oral taxon 955]